MIENMKNIKIISIDFQKEFSNPIGKHYKKRPCVNFIKKTLVPFLKENKIKITEIISDYRQPRPGDLDDCCYPGTQQYESEIPNEIKIKPIWIKCMNSPIWIRKNIGEANKKPGLPYQGPKEFTDWLNKVVGKPEEIDLVILIGLTLDCCVFSTAQELTWRGYKIKILKEGVDTYTGSLKEKEIILNHYPLINWAESISFEELKKLLEK